MTKYTITIIPKGTGKFSSVESDRPRGAQSPRYDPVEDEPSFHVAWDAVREARKAGKLSDHLRITETSIKLRGKHGRTE